MSLASSIRAGSAYVEIALRDNKFSSGLQSAMQRLRAFDANVRKLGVRGALQQAMTGEGGLPILGQMFAIGEGLRKLGLRATAAGSAVLVPLLGMAKAFASAGDEIEKMSRRTGFAAQALSELRFAAEQSGITLSDLNLGLTAMARFSRAVSEGSQAAASVLENIGISIDQFAQSSPEERFKLLADGIASIADPTLRAGTALAIFGRTGASLVPMIERGRAGIEAYQAMARELGITMTTRDATAAAALNDAMNRLSLQVRALIAQIGAALAPALVEIQERIAPVITTIIDWIKENRGLVITIAKVAAIVIAGGVAMLALGSIISTTVTLIGGMITIVTTLGAVVGAVVSAIGSIFAALTAPIGLVALAIGGLAGIFLYVSGAGAKLMNGLRSGFATLKQDATAAWGGIKSALASGDIGLAAKIFWLTLKMEWKRGIHFLNQLWVGAKQFVVSTFIEAMYQVQSAINNGIDAIDKAWVDVTTWLADAWSVFTNFLTTSWHSAVGFIRKAWVRLKSLFSDDVNVDIEVARIDREVREASEAATAAMLEDVQRRDAARQKRRDELEATRAQTENELSRERTNALAKMQQQYAQELAGTARELAAVRRAWQQAIGAAQEQRKTPAIQAPEGTPEYYAEWRKQQQMLKETRVGLEVKGTFNAMVVRGLGAESLAERTAKATEQTAKAVEKNVEVNEEIATTVMNLEEEVKMVRMVFGP